MNESEFVGVVDRLLEVGVPPTAIAKAFDIDPFVVRDRATELRVERYGSAELSEALANPDPEIDPASVLAARPDAIIATGRSDYPNQVNNVLGFPYIFRGALDVRASTINEAMKIAAAEALAELELS